MKSDFSRIGFDPAHQFTAVLFQQGRVTLDRDANEQAAIHAHFYESLASSLTGTEGAIFLEPTPLIPLENRNLPGFRILHAGMFRKGKPVLGQRDTDAARKEGVEEALRDADGVPRDTDPLDVFEEHDVWISPGHYYVGGLRCENEAWVPLENQPHLPKNYALLPAKPKEEERLALFYLDAWERPLSWLDDPAISDIALGSAVDTTMRAKLVWQVKVAKGVLPTGTPPPPPPPPAPAGEVNPQPGDNPTRLAPAGKSSSFDADEWRQKLPWFRPKPRLRVRIKPGHNTGDPCRPSFATGWQGLENQLYRVEIHAPVVPDAKDKAATQPPATFKWSRENGSVAALVQSAEGDAVRIFPGQLRGGGFQPGDWVEIITLDNDLSEAPGGMVRISKVQGDRITLEKFQGAAPKAGDKLRRWDQRPCDGGVLPVKEGWIDLEGGIQVRFEPSENPPKTAEQKEATAAAATDWTKTTFATGDYWVFTARTATADVDWPAERPEEPSIPAALSARLQALGLFETQFGGPVPVRATGHAPAALEGVPAALPPHGVRHRYAILAVANWESEAWNVEDLRRILQLCKRVPKDRVIFDRQNLEFAGAPGTDPEKDAVSKKTKDKAKKPE